MNENCFSVDLRPDRKLLDPSFTGYKLALDSVPTYRKSISTGVDLIQPNDDQFSFAHVKLFSLQNHLYVNPYSNAIYFTDKNWNIIKIILNELNKLEELQVVYKIPPLEESKKRLYNVSMTFAAPDKVIISNGAGTVHIISVKYIENKEVWETDSSNVLCDYNIGFILTSAMLQIIETEKILHIVFMHVEEKKDKPKEIISKGSFHTVVEWVILNQNKNKWIQKSHKKLEVNGNVEYVSLEPDCKALFIVSDKVPKWTFDSSKSIVEPKTVDENINESMTSNDTVGDNIKKLYTWSQGEEDISVWIPIPEDLRKCDLQLIVEQKKLEIKLKGEIILSGELSNKVDKTLTSWSVEKNKIELQLVKEETGLMWQNFILNDNRGEQIYNPELVGRVHEQLAHLCSDKEVDPGQPSFNSQQLEECDTMSCDTSVLVRMSAETQSATHEVSLSSFQWLFKVQCDFEKPPAICLRHDVDACVWQFDKAEENDKNWPYKHIGTFFAFGYVQASKNQKKYLISPPNLSYVVICEASRHIYLYRQPSAVVGELRNRMSGKKVETVSKQQLVNLDTNEQILGIHATDSLLFVLTENIIHVLVINE